ncbi:MAG: class I SAM-dependent methyltransferase [Candidatus Nanohaloarchaea archaeon]|nr:class I SAM-dependent methyltransferase [Candidatus Nanohaloarchaea archaeon]
MVTVDWEDYIDREMDTSWRTYARLAEVYGGEYYEEVAEDVASELDDRGIDRMLDAGTGPGFLPRAITERQDVTVDAVDITRDLLLYGRGPEGRNSINFVTGDIHHLPLQDEQYPFVTCTGVLHMLDEPVRAVDELYRVMDEEAEAWIFDPAVLQYDGEVSDHLSSEEQEVWDAFKQNLTEEKRPETYSREEARAIMSASQFEDFTVSDGPWGDLRIATKHGQSLGLLGRVRQRLEGYLPDP